MPAPATIEDFFTVVQRSKLVAADDLDGYRSRAAIDPQPPAGIADWMLRDGLVTPFQVALLLEGKSRPFFVGPYKVLSRLGSGSMGVVYLCEHVAMRRKVAVKVLQGRHVKDEVALQRFLREARAAASLNHPNVVHALDLGTEGELHYLSMEYIDGASLKELVRAEGPLAPRRLAGYMRQAAMGLQHAHEAGLIHRDVTPSNVMVDRDEVVKVLDLGLALFADGDVNLTHGVRLGSLAYVAPEQARDSHAVDARADIYALGATFYFAMTGRPPDPGAGVKDTSAPSGCDGADFSRLLAIIQRMTAANPDARFQTAGEVAEAVASWVRPSPPALPLATAVEISPPQVSETSTDFAFDPAPLARVEAPRAFKKRAAPQRRALAADPATSTPLGRRARQPKTSTTSAGWLYRYRWPLAMTLAVLVGLAASFLTRVK